MCWKLLTREIRMALDEPYWFERFCAVGWKCELLNYQKPFTLLVSFESCSRFQRNDCSINWFNFPFFECNIRILQNENWYFINLQRTMRWSIIESICWVNSNLKIPKTERNSFGKFAQIFRAIHTLQGFKIQKYLRQSPLVTTHLRSPANFCSFCFCNQHRATIEWTAEPSGGSSMLIGRRIVFAWSFRVCVSPYAPKD